MGYICPEAFRVNSEFQYRSKYISLHCIIFIFDHIANDGQKLNTANLTIVDVQNLGTWSLKKIYDSCIQDDLQIHRQSRIP